MLRQSMFVESLKKMLKLHLQYVSGFSESRLISADLSDRYTISCMPSEYSLLSGGPHNQDRR